MAKAPLPAAGKTSPIPASAPGSGPGSGAADSKISRVDAQGHVVITNALDTGRGDYGVYNAESGICTLVDNVVIARGKDVIKGQYGVMDLNKNVSRMLPSAGAPGAAPQRVQGLFIRDDEARGTGGISGRKPASSSDKKP